MTTVVISKTGVASLKPRAGGRHGASSWRGPVTTFGPSSRSPYSRPWRHGATGERETTRRGLDSKPVAALPLVAPGRSECENTLAAIIRASLGWCWSLSAGSFSCPVRGKALGLGSA